MLQELTLVLDYLVNQMNLPEKYRDHELTGNMKGIRECHVKPDALLLAAVLLLEKVSIIVVSDHYYLSALLNLFTGGFVNVGRGITLCSGSTLATRSRVGTNSVTTLRYSIAWRTINPAIFIEMSYQSYD